VTAGAVPESTATTDATPGAGPRLGRWLRWLLVLALIAAVSRLVHRSDLERAWSLVRGVGWPIGLIAVPTLVAMMLDARGWQAILATLGHQVPWRRLLALRLTVEAIVLAMPGGSVAGEATKVALLRRRAGIPATTGAASLALTKMALVSSDAAYLAFAGIWLLASGLPSSPLPALLCLGGALLTGVMGAALALALRRSTIASALGQRLARLPIPAVARWFRQREAELASLDGATRRHFALPLRARVGSLLPFALEWFVEGLETLVILRCLGVHVGVPAALTLDATGSLLRAMVFFVPAGLGFQDAAQVLVLAGLGTNDPVATGTAFSVLKRTKEFFWIAIGSLLTAATKGPWRRAVTDRDT
jgi:uncharacterized membrane protein YbhN (UPF0104 family)